jgi:hypothetical protein
MKRDEPVTPPHPTIRAFTDCHQGWRESFSPPETDPETEARPCHSSHHCSQRCSGCSSVYRPRKVEFSDHSLGGNFTKEATGNDTHLTGQVLRTTESRLCAHGNTAVDVIAVNADERIALIALNPREEVGTPDLLQILLYGTVGALHEPTGYRQFLYFT